MNTDYKIKESLKSTKILILEDDEIMLRLLRDVLTVMGFGEIVVAKEGKKALELIQAKDFDLIFCDWRMRGMDGLEFTRAIRSVPEGNKRFTPIIMITGYAQQQDVETARDAGVTEYLIKPISIQAMCLRIKSIVENPRSFVISEDYKGPDRRRKNEPHKIPGGVDRRTRK